MKFDSFKNPLSAEAKHKEEREKLEKLRGEYFEANGRWVNRPRHGDRDQEVMRMVAREDGSAKLREYLQENNDEISPELKEVFKAKIALLEAGGNPDIYATAPYREGQDKE